MYPIRVGMKTQTELNGKIFILRILEGNKAFANHPCYSCQCESFSSNIEESPTKAISSLYQKIFQTSTKISGSLAMGYDDNTILKELLQDIEFRPYSILVEKFSIMIYGLGVSAREGWMRAGFEFISSFIYVISKKRCVVVQKFSDNKSIIEIWHENKKIS